MKRRRNESKKRPILHGLPRPSIQHRPDDNVVINRSKSVRDGRSLPLFYLPSKRSTSSSRRTSDSNSAEREREKERENSRSFKAFQSASAPLPLLPLFHPLLDPTTTITTTSVDSLRRLKTARVFIRFLFCLIDL